MTEDPKQGTAEPDAMVRIPTIEYQALRAALAQVMGVRPGQVRAVILATARFKEAIHTELTYLADSGNVALEVGMPPEGGSDGTE